MKPVLVMIVGATGTGKTALAVHLAKHFGTEIISADSRQLYRQMHIGTAKPTPEEQQGIRHHFVHSHSIHEPFTVADFEAQALAILENLFQKHQVVIAAGGTGLFIKVLGEGIDTMPDADPEIRLQLTQQLENEGIGKLFSQLQILDPVYAAQVDSRNPQRILRALEICQSTGLPYSAFRTGKKAERHFRIIKIGLERERAELYERLNDRMDKMLDAGLVEEARQLFDFRQHNALQTVGYQEVFDFLEGKTDKAEMVRLLKQNTRRYAKRQLTWFRRDPDIHWFGAEDWSGILDFVKKERYD
jgi:tRNA dimethylallyltransferase